MPGSGSTPWAKEDYETEYYLFQHKFVLPATKSHSIKMSDLEELRRNAIDRDKKPCYVIEHNDRRWFLVSEEDFGCIPQS